MCSINITNMLLLKDCVASCFINWCKTENNYNRQGLI